MTPVEDKEHIEFICTRVGIKSHGQVAWRPWGANRFSRMTCESRRYRSYCPSWRSHSWKLSWCPRQRFNPQSRGGLQGKK